MQKLSKATQRCVEDFVKTVLNWAPRALTEYEKSALAYALYTILRYQEIFWEDSVPFTEDKNSDKKRFDFHMEDHEVYGRLCIKQFYDLAESVSEYLEHRISIFDEVDDVKECPTFYIFLDLVFLFHQWEKNYAKELAAEYEDEELPF